MKAFFAGLVAVVAAAFIAAVLWKSAPSVDWMRPTDDALRRARVEERAARVRAERQQAEQRNDEWREERRERLALLTATLATHPISQLNRAETRLFQQASREHARQRAIAESGATVWLREPVQIDEWTVLAAGSAVEFIHYDRDDVVTIRHDGARYQVGSHQITHR
jgi:hypothetical protein